MYRGVRQFLAMWRPTLTMGLVDFEKWGVYVLVGMENFSVREREQSSS